MTSIKILFLHQTVLINVLLEGNSDGCAKKCKLFQPTGLHNLTMLFMLLIPQSYCVKIFTTLEKTAKFLKTIGNLYKAYFCSRKKK